MRQRHPVRPQHADIAAGKRHILQLRPSLITLVVREQYLTAPDRTVGPVSRSVEGEAEYLLCSVEAVLGHHRRDVRMMVLHRSHRPIAGVAVRPGGGAIGRMRVRDHDFRCDAG